MAASTYYSDNFAFQALYAGRPTLEEKEKDGEFFRYKHGCHFYIGEIQAHQQAHILAFEKAVAFFASPAAEGHDVVRIMKDRYSMPRAEIAKIFDPNINMAKSVLLPGCRKKGGHATYFPTRVFNYTLAINENGPFIMPGPVQVYQQEPLQRFFPIHIGKETYTVTTAFDQQAVALPKELEYAVVGSEEEEFLEEAKQRCDSAAILIMLLKIIPYDKIADQAKGHEYRLKLINGVVYEISPETERKEWARRILFWCFNKGAVPPGSDFNTAAHIEERIDAVIEGKRSIATELLEGGGEKLLTEMSNDELLRFVALDLSRATEA